MAYVKVTPPSVVYHLTRMENLDSILDDGKISRFLDSECWFCESLGKMKAYMEQTVMCEGKPYYAVGGQLCRYPKFVPEDYVLLKLTPCGYRWALERLEDIKGHRIDRLHIVGGGSQNRFLNQLAADAIDRPVITGPVEGAALGNILAQAMALGDIKSIDDLRDVVRESVDMETYTPNHTLGWEAAYRKLCDFYKELSS